MKKLFLKKFPNETLGYFDYLIVGGGIIGLTIARQIKMMDLNSKLLIIEKYDELCSQASINNSGVLHAGFYYSTESLKAKFCLRGNQLLTKYCKDQKISFKNCGKIVLPTNKDEYDDLLQFYERGKTNGVDLEMIEFSDAIKIEPSLSKKALKSRFPCLFSKTTSIASQRELRDVLEKEINSFKNVQIMKNCEFIKKSTEDSIQTSKGIIYFDYLINCAGTHADEVAKSFGFCEDYVSLPFKGNYLYDQTAKMNTLIYPVPQNMGKNFLGVHYTITFDGHVKIGPNALPCFSRDLNSFEIYESCKLGWLYFKCLLSKERGYYIQQLLHELKKSKMSNVILEAKRLCDVHEKDPSLKNYNWGKPGIRSQLVNKKSMKLESDFIVEGNEKSLHLLNIISPGWTSSMAMAEDIVQKIISNRKRITS